MTNRFVQVALGILVLLAVQSAALAQWQAYYVAPEGSDAAAGSFAEPFGTLGRALDVMAAGDTVWVRGGTYASPASIRVEQEGADSAYFHIFAYPGEEPIFDFTGTDRDGLDIRGSYIHVKGLVLQHAGHAGLFLKGADWTVIENVTTRYNLNSGLQAEDGASNNLILNSDSYENYDPQSHGENADGFAIKFEVGPGNVLRGCRSWGNSDDGFDFWEAGEGVTVEESWSFRNGINNWDDSDFQGDSNGFKLGHGAGAHRLVRNLAWGHLKHGFDVNGNTTGVTLYNNTAFDNGDRNFYFDEDTSAHVLRNNISLSGDVLMFAAIDDSNNTWNGINAGGVDFVSLSDAGADGPRGADGSLPVLPFLRLSCGTSLADAGVDVGIPFAGSAPDLGAFEGATCVGTESEIPREVHVSMEAYPNPFQRLLTIEIELPTPSTARIDLYDALGRRIALIAEGPFQAGTSLVTWNPQSALPAAGRYYLRASGDFPTQVRAIIFSGARGRSATSR